MQRPIKFSSFTRIMNELGWDFDGIWSDRRVFVKPNRLPITVRVHRGRVPDSYAKPALRIALDDFFR